MIQNMSNNTNDRNREEKFSDKIRYSKYWMRYNTIRNNPQLDRFLNRVYYNPELRQKLINGVSRGISGVESIGLGMSIAWILALDGYVATKIVPIYNIINIKNAHIYEKQY